MLEHYRKRLRVTVGLSVSPYGFTLATWTTGAVLAHARGIPDALATLTFMAGAVLGFAFVGTLAFGGVAKRFDQDHDETLLIWESLRLFSVGLAIGVASLVAYYVEGRLAWAPGSFLHHVLLLAFRAALAFATADSAPWCRPLPRRF